jgi:hypothetical protein
MAPQKEEASVGLCPWRNPEADMHRFFPGAVGMHEETLILSGLRLQAATRLGRAPTGEENALRLYRIGAEGGPRGVILTRRIRGDAGVIELVLAIDPAGRVAGSRIQRLREPDSVAAVLQSSRVLGALGGRTASSGWAAPTLLPADCRDDAAAIFDGARTALTLYDVARRAPMARPRTE